MSVKVPLSRGLVALVDDEDAERVLAIKWHAMPKAGTSDFYARNGRGGSKPTRHGVRYLHRFVLNAPADAMVDHINGQGLDCRKANLRLCDWSGNNANRPVRDRGLPRGVYAAPGGRFRAQITIARRDISLGHFRTADEAGAAYAKAAREAFGAFARVEVAA